MRTSLRALWALIITGLLITTTVSVVMAEGTREACWQQKVGSLRLATEILPCKDTSENSIILQTGEPEGGSDINMWGNRYSVEAGDLCNTESAFEAVFVIDDPALNGVRDAIVTASLFDSGAGVGVGTTYIDAGDTGDCPAGHWAVFPDGFGTPWKVNVLALIP